MSTPVCASCNTVQDDEDAVICSFCKLDICTDTKDTDDTAITHCQKCNADASTFKENRLGDIVCPCGSLVEARTDRCDECSADFSLLEETQEGEMVCTQCGTVNTNKKIFYQGPPRVFEDDPESKNNATIQYYNPSQYHNLLGSYSSHNNIHRDPNTFFINLTSTITSRIQRLFATRELDQNVMTQAHSYANRLFHGQYLEKQGLSYIIDTSTRRGVRMLSGDSLPYRKYNYSSANMIATVSIYKALLDNDIKLFQVCHYSEPVLTRNAVFRFLSKKRALLTNSV